MRYLKLALAMAQPRWIIQRQLVTRLRKIRRFSRLFAVVVAAHAASASAGSPPLIPKDSERVERLISSMTLEEKITMIGGSGIGTQPIPRLGIPPFRMSDGPSGVRSPG